jgi:ADP-ribosylglycohydrolase
MHKGIGGAETAIVYKAYLRWLQTQTENDAPDESGWLIRQKELHKRRAPGNTCLSALQSKEIGSVKNKINDSKGCGTVMRMAPVGIFYHGDRKRAFKKGVAFSALTHGHPSGYLSGGFLAALIADLLQEENLENSIDNAIKELVEWDDHQEVLEIIELALSLYHNSSDNTFAIKILETIGAGWVAEEALAMSLFCTLKFQNDFEKGVLAAVNHSGDSDSTGAITGNLLGLMLGTAGIPPDWQENLLYKDIVIEVANDLYLGFKDSERWWGKYPGF